MTQFRFEPQTKKAYINTGCEVYTIDTTKMRKYLDRKKINCTKISQFLNFFSMNIDTIPKSYYRVSPKLPLDDGCYPTK